MQTEIKSNFEKLLDDGSFSNSQKEIKELCGCKDSN